MVWVFMATTSCGKDNAAHAITSIEFDKKELDMNVGDTGTIAVITPIGDNTIAWNRDDPEIAEVDQNGSVKAMANCSVIVTLNIFVAGQERNGEILEERNSHYSYRWFQFCSCQFHIC